MNGDMDIATIRQQIREAATQVCRTLNTLQGIERQFNEELTDENGKNVEAEYYALHNAIENIESAYNNITIIDYGRTD